MATLQSLWNPEAVAARGQDGEAMLVIWLSHGHPLAMASIYP